MTTRLRFPATLALCTSLASSSALGQSTPERPAIWREVTGIINGANPHDPQFQQPHVPSFRTTQDGRIAMNVKGVPLITLLKPEKIDGSADPLLHQPKGSYTMSLGERDSVYPGGSEAAAKSIFVGSGSPLRVVHGCLWDDALPTSNAQGQDVYEIKVLVTSRDPATAGTVRFHMAPLTVTVDNPKTGDAQIASIEHVAGSTIDGPLFSSSSDVARKFSSIAAFEPTIVDDGRTIVFRIGSNDLPGPRNDGSDDQYGDIVYSHYTGGQTADPTKWTEVYPISHAFHDKEVNAQGAKLGFAEYQLCDPEGTYIPDWEDMGGTYPWMDRAAKNLFFTTIGAQLHYLDNGTWQQGRYNVAGVPNDPNLNWGNEDFGKLMGVAFAGLWSRGKMVLLDNQNNDMDYAIGRSGGNVPNTNNVGAQQRLVTLYLDTSATYGSDELRLGYGRSNAGATMPEGENENTTIIESMENIFNYKKNVRPITTRDVVWFLQNGRHTDELPFDDYVDPDALVIADMSGLLQSPTTWSGSGRNDLIYHDGWNATAHLFTEEVRLQNASTAHHRWNLPPHGRLINPTHGRLEPAAAGGIHGKGLWLDDGIALEFNIPDQQAAPSGLDPATRSSYVSLYVDCRFSDTAPQDRVLLKFPDSSRLILRGRDQVVFDDGSYPVHVATMPESFTDQHGSLHEFLPERGWTHLALRIEEQGSRVTLLVNGFPLSRYEDPTRSIFRVYGGTLVLGDPVVGGGPDFRGWVDELKVFLHDVDPETACNLAGGTLLGIEASQTPSFTKESLLAARFPDWAHDEIALALTARGESSAYKGFACLYDYKADNGVHAGAIPALTQPLREAIHFPEGPLFFDAPRPDSTTNAFCLSCHTSDDITGLRIEALAHSDTHNALTDPRRQPMQPPAQISGFIPQGLLNTVSPAMPPSNDNLGSATQRIDEWLLEEAGTRVFQVQSLTLINGDTGRDLIPLSTTGSTAVDPATLGTKRFSVRTNLDAAQGKLTMTMEFPPVPPPGSSRLPQTTVTEHAPYTMFPTANNPLAGWFLAPGTHTLTVTPDGGPATVATFEVLGGAERIIARYGADFVDNSPGDGWTYCWNRSGPVSAPTDRRTLNWNEDETMYTESGANWPSNSTELAWGALSATGGWPGDALLASPTDDRYVMAGYRVHADGFVAVQGLDVGFLNSNSTGLDVAIYRETGTGMIATPEDSWAPTPSNPLVNVASPQFSVSSGDIVWVAIGPGASHSADRFSLDYEIWFNETSW